MSEHPLDKKLQIVCCIHCHRTFAVVSSFQWVHIPTHYPTSNEMEDDEYLDEIAALDSNNPFLQ